MGFGSAQCDFRYSERKHNKCHTNATFTAATLQLLILLSTLQLLYKKKDMAQKMMYSGLSFLVLKLNVQLILLFVLLVL